MEIERWSRELTEKLSPLADTRPPGDVFEDKKPASLSKYIDHTILKPEATDAEIRAVCAEAVQYDFASVCVNHRYVKKVSKLLAGSSVKTCNVVGFPLGATATIAKVFETSLAIADGAGEIDMVIGIGAVKSGDWPFVFKDIRAVVDVARGRIIVKAIIETCLLTDEEKVKACMAAKLAGVHFVKTSTGFSSGGATVHDVRLMRETVGAHVGVKASGGVRTYADAMRMIEAGATRLGTSAGVAIVSPPKP
ncbi:MAG: deoxyribose-phosphate aldolase [Clostridiales Family XIII bacterium]|jgi:deoxyribose-phosphate aldolase|nr:deoxyribose-phosphate aldolase [Clostridiales Family XIII bacterium]